MVFRLHREREEQMRLLTSQLLLLEANLRAKQSKIDGLLHQRDRTISHQQEKIRKLERQLERCRCSESQQDPAETKTVPSAVPSNSVAVRILGHEHGDESLDDSDSAVVIEDDHHAHSPTFTQVSFEISLKRSWLSRTSDIWLLSLGLAGLICR